MLMANFEKSLDNYINIAARKNKTELHNFHAWKVKLLQYAAEKCDILYREADAEHHTFLSPEGMAELKRLQQEMVITYADKSSHDFVLCCKHVYKHALWKEVHSPHYEEIQKGKQGNLG